MGSEMCIRDRIRIVSSEQKQIETLNPIVVLIFCQFLLIRIHRLAISVTVSYKAGLPLLETAVNVDKLLFGSYVVTSTSLALIARMYVHLFKNFNLLVLILCHFPFTLVGKS